MKKFFSFNVSSQHLRLVHILDLYKFCQKHSSTVYIYAKDKCCKVEYLPNLVSFVISLNCRVLMIVVEGDHSMEEKQLLEKLLKSNHQIKGIIPS